VVKQVFEIGGDPLSTDGVRRPRSLARLEWPADHHEL